MSASPSCCPKFVAPTLTASVFQAGERKGKREILCSREPFTSVYFPGKLHPTILCHLVGFPDKRSHKKGTINFCLVLFGLMGSLLAHKSFFFGGVGDIVAGPCLRTSDIDHEMSKKHGIRRLPL